MDPTYENEFAAESSHLHEVVAHIDQEIKAVHELGPATAWYQETANILQRKNQAALRELKAARPDPYFGRLDFSREEGSGETETIYIGKYGVDGAVTDWRAETAALYYNPERGGYLVKTDGVLDARKATVSLKRGFEIETLKLHAFTDVLRLGQTSSAQVSGRSDPALDKALSDTGTFELGEAVATIQPSQYEQIASTDHPVTIIQGAAGSGKSLVGLHRMAYLLSPFNRTGNPPAPERVVMIGPSQAFLSYAKNLLPALGEYHIAQITLDTWLLKTFTKTPRIDRRHRLLRQLMGNRALPLEIEYEAELFKGSMAMAAMLREHIERRRRALNTAVQITKVVGARGEFAVNDGMIKRNIVKSMAMPLNVARNHFINSLVRDLWERTDLTATPGSLQPFQESLRPDIEAQVDRYWPLVTVEEEYVSFLSNVDSLLATGKGKLPGALAPVLQASLPLGDQPFADTDVAPLLFLDHLINRHPGPEFEHVVVDEAQEVSPLEFHLLKMHSRNGWFTILGDLRQRMVPYKGIANWQELRGVFGADYTKPQVSRISYRQTAEITRFSNRVLRRVLGSTLPPIPFARQGARPKFARSNSASDMYREIAERAQEALRQGLTVGVLTRTSTDAKVTTDSLLLAGVTEARQLGPEAKVETSLTVSPILLTKGLEFDLVIAAGVDSKSFTGSDMDNRLIYLACTRARHFLELHWFGVVSPVLADVGASGVDLGGELKGARSKKSLFKRIVRK